MKTCLESASFRKIFRRTLTQAWLAMTVDLGWVVLVLILPGETTTVLAA
jgi:hypothetical protein